MITPTKGTKGTSRTLKLEMQRITLTFENKCSSTKGQQGMLNCRKSSLSLR